MRGDKPGGGSGNSREAIDAYLHTYYEDIRDLYLERIYKLGV
jgi:integrase/recombinase XerD